MPESSSLFPGAHPERLRRVFERTEIKRTPLTGIVQGYHTLPFSLVGPNDTHADETAHTPEPDSAPENFVGSVLLTGKISVSPKLIMPVGASPESFGDVFPEEEPFMDPGLVGRIFAFAVGKGRNLRIRNEHLQIETFADSDAIVLERVLDDLDRSETIDRAVIWCPEPRFYPVSLEKFILSVLEREFR
jgi:hypothetical protein